VSFKSLLLLTFLRPRCIIQVTHSAHLSQATMRLPGQPCDSPSADDSLHSLALGDGDGVNHLVGLEDGVHCHSLLEHGVCKVHLRVDAATIDLHTAVISS
jgi:hypothetical protein